MKNLISFLTFLAPVCLFAQTTSEYGNTAMPAIPSALNNCGFGISALNGNVSATGQLNTATGFRSLSINNTGNENTANGAESMLLNELGNENTGIGFQSLYDNGCGSCNGGHFNCAVGALSMRYNNDGNGNTATGANALFRNTTGSYNLAIGNEALKGALFASPVCNVVGENNVGIGSSSLYNNFEGFNNTAFGFEALRSNSYGSENVAFGSEALESNVNSINCNYSAFPNDNSAIGNSSLRLNNGGIGNVAIGKSALEFNTTNNYNVGVGYEAIASNQADANVGVGYRSGVSNTNGTYNTSIGTFAMFFNNGGDKNTAVGMAAMGQRTGGHYNVSIGAYSGQYGSTKDYNTMFGANSDMGNDVTNSGAIGFNSKVPADNIIELGDVNTQSVVTQNQFVVVSDGRFKENLSETDVKGLEFITKLRPVTYQFDTWKLEQHRSKNIKQMQEVNNSKFLSELEKRTKAEYEVSSSYRRAGLIAQEVEQAAKEVNFDFSAIYKPTSDVDNYSLDYNLFVVPLVKAVQEQQAQIELQNRATECLKKDVYNKVIFESVLALNNMEKSQDLSSKNNISSDQFYLNAIPNPFNSETKIEYFIPENIVEASLIICNLDGKLVRSFQITSKGASSYILNSDKMKDGIYIYSLVGDGKILGSKRLVYDSK